MLLSLLTHFNPCIYSIGDWLEDHSGTIGALIIIIVFFIERRLNHAIRKKETISSWYLNFILKEHVSVIEDFFNDQKRNLIRIKEIKETDDLATKSTLQLALLDDLSGQFKEFRDRFLSLIPNFDSSLFQELSDTTEQLNDNLSVLIFEEDAIVEDELIADSRARFYDILSKPVNPKFNPSKKKR